MFFTQLKMSKNPSASKIDKYYQDKEEKLEKNICERYKRLQKKQKKHNNIYGREWYKNQR